MSGEMTIVLLNFRRPVNIPILLDSIRRQTVRPVVFLWNNGPDDVNLPGVDRYEQSGENVGCMVRWKMAREADTPYVMSLDDDLCFARDDALADVIASLRAMDDPARIVGPVGCSFGGVPSYVERHDVNAGFARAHVERRAVPPGEDLAVDMVKGRAMALRRDRLDGLALPQEREDDIYLSACLAGGRRQFHRVPLRLRNAFRVLPELGVGNWKMPGHLASRDRATATYFFPGVRGEVSGCWRPRRRGAVERRDGDELLIRLGEGDGARLNPTAALIWERCDGRRTEAELLAELGSLFAAPEDLLRRDLREVLERLCAIGALEPKE